jgi:hypothetical protein
MLQGRVKTKGLDYLNLTSLKKYPLVTNFIGKSDTQKLTFLIDVISEYAIFSFIRLSFWLCRIILKIHKLD